jgi:hypothetical protein
VTTGSDERAATSQGNLAVRRQLFRNVAMRGFGWAVATAVMTFEFHLIQTGRSPKFTHLLAIAAVGSLAIGWSAWAESIFDPSPHGQPWQRGLAWGVAFVIAVMVFWYWNPLTDALGSLWGHPSGVNVVHLPTPFDPSPPDGSVVSDSRSQTLVNMSPVEIRFFAALVLFGVVGGLGSGAARSAGSWYALRAAAVSSFVWTIGVIVGGVCLFIGFYVFVGILAAVFKPAVLVGAELGSGLAGFLAGAVAAAIGLPVEIGMAERRPRP